MLQITRSATSTIVVTLKENQTLDNPFFLFRFTHEALNTEKVLIASDSSGYPERYNKFQIAESSNEDPLDARVSLEPGIWVYRVYEQISNSNLVWQNADNQEPLEVGLMNVIGPASETFHTPNYTDTMLWQR